MYIYISRPIDSLRVCQELVYREVLFPAVISCLAFPFVIELLLLIRLLLSLLYSIGFYSLKCLDMRYGSLYRVAYTSLCLSTSIRILAQERGYRPCRFDWVLSGRFHLSRLFSGCSLSNSEPLCGVLCRSKREKCISRIKNNTTTTSPQL